MPMTEGHSCEDNQKVGYAFSKSGMKGATKLYLGVKVRLAVLAELPKERGIWRTVLRQEQT